jgi:hypothetical protein
MRSGRLRSRCLPGEAFSGVQPALGGNEWPGRVVVVVVAMLACLVGCARAEGKSAVSVSLTISVSGNGAVLVLSPSSGRCRSSCSLSMSVGATVTLEAAADLANHFDSWSGACVGAAPDCSMVIPDQSAVSAAFQAGGPAFAATSAVVVPSRLSVTTSGRGRVLSDAPASINCDADGSGGPCWRNLPNGTSVTLTATADANSSFQGWTGPQGCSGLGACHLTLGLAELVNVSALFAPASQLVGTSDVTLNNQSADDMDVFVPRSGGCGRSACVSSFSICASKQTCVYTAVANGSTVTFQGDKSLLWSQGCVGEGDTCRLVVAQSTTVTVPYLSPLDGYSSFPLWVSSSQGGRITTSGSAIDPPIDCGATCKTSVGRGVQVTLSETPSPGWHFDNWSADCMGIGSTCTFTVGTESKVVATFERCAAMLPKMNVTVGRNTSPRGVVVTLDLAGSATVSIDVRRKTRTLVSTGGSLVPAGPSQPIPVALPASAPKAATTFRVVVRIQDLCGNTKNPSYQVRL